MMTLGISEKYEKLEGVNVKTQNLNVSLDR